MYLKSLELHGFKSFPNRTVLTFERGATVIVGPNGSGKSNISDAMRWVLGELSSRNIRGTKMEDVIFGGTDERRPMGFAEVTVVFDNSEPNRLDSPYDEVSVTRRYFRTGESEYMINKTPCRLRDIYELFMNTGVGREGYSIIGQGKIAEIISKKSDERRNIFEEAAGISKYRHRKEESERKLKAVQDNLDRVKDILGELEGRVGPLEKEAERARKGLAVYEEKKRADVSLWLYDTKKILDDIKEADDAWRLSKNELDILESQLADLETQTETLYSKTQSNKLLSAELLEQSRLTTERIHALDSALRVAESDCQHVEEMVARYRERIAEIERTYATVQHDRDEKEAALRATEKDMKELLDQRLECLAEQQQAQAEVDRAKGELTAALDELTVEENAATDLRVRLDVLKNARDTDGNKSRDIEEEIRTYEEEGKALKEEADRCEANAAGFKAQIEEKDAVLREAAERQTAIGERREELQAEIGRLQVERDTLLQRADTLKRMSEHLEGYSESIKFVMREYNAGHISGAGKIHGPLSSLIQVDKRYITAIETALGASLQNIVVESEETAKAAIRALKQANAGRATFYPITAIKPMSETDEIREASHMEGFVGRADTLVESGREYRSIVEWLLLRTCVFDTIDHASVAAKRLRYRVKIVTLDGQVINTGGAFTGGSAKRDSGILSRMSEIDKLQKNAKALDEKLQERSTEKQALDAELRTVVDNSRDAEQEKELLLTLSRNQFAALDSANAKYNANRNIVEKLTQDYKNIIGQQSAVEEELTSVTQAYAAAEERIAALKEFRTKRSAEMGVLDESIDRLASQANDLYIQATERRKDMENADQLAQSLDARLCELDAEKATQQSHIDELYQKRDTIQQTRESTKQQTEALESTLDELNRRRRDVEEGTDEFDRELTRIRQKQKEKSSSRDVLYETTLRNENRANQLKEKQDKLGSQLWDDYEITYEDAVALQYPPVTEETREEVAKLQVSCKARLRAIGNYNPAAIEEYAEVKTRYDALNTQYTDLTASYDELIGIINRLEVEMRDSFTTAFETINRNFGVTFRELFGGGSAELSLTDPEDVLTSGIEIKAAPPGKIIKSMSLLSGGEQSFVAIALLFAILKANPTPFCILDEIEAALDEVNVYRFGDYIKKFDDDTQFILITHRRGTMEVGDRLYGVTMPQRGISQAIELNVNEIEGKQKELLDGVL